MIMQRASLLLSLREIGLELDAESIAHGGSVAAVLPKEDEEAKPIEGPQVFSLNNCLPKLKITYTQSLLFVVH